MDSKCCNLKKCKWCAACAQQKGNIFDNCKKIMCTSIVHNYLETPHLNPTLLCELFNMTFIKYHTVYRLKLNTFNIISPGDRRLSVTIFLARVS